MDDETRHEFASVWRAIGQLQPPAEKGASWVKSTVALLTAGGLFLTPIVVALQIVSG